MWTPLRVLLIFGAPALCGALCASALSASAAPSTEIFFPVGVWYGGGTARAPMIARNPANERDLWRRDLQTIKSLGFNHVKTWVDWATAEPRRGEFRLEALEQLLTLADQAGLRVIVQVYADSAPEWVGVAHPDARFVSDKGLQIRSQAAPGFCLDHQAVRASVGQFISAVSALAQRHRAFYGLDVWSEPHIVNWAWFNEPIEFCFCPHTIARFRGWLRDKYESLDALNRAWYRTFDSWDQVEPPRFGTILSYADFIDWKTFIPWKLEDDLRMKAHAARGAGARGFKVSSHSDAPAVLLSPLSGFGSPDDWWMVRAVDHYGTSIYPKHASAATPWSPVRLMSGLDGIRSAARERGWWIGELQGGQGATGVRVADPVTAADLRLWGWSAVTRGARSISYYAWYPMSSGYESSGYGMIELDGTVTDRARAAGSFADLVSRNANLFTELRPERARVAIVYNRLSHMAGGNTVGPGLTARQSVIGAYRAFYEENLQVDFVHSDEIVAGRLSDYRAVYFPYPIMMAGRVAEALKDYVHAGGVLIAEARPAWNDERGSANSRIPGAGLDEVFGAREEVLYSNEPLSMTVSGGVSPVLDPLAGQTVPGASYLETLHPGETARVFATTADGAPAATLHEFGAGRAVLIGSFIAAAFEQDPQKNAVAGALIASLARLAGVEPRVAVIGDPAARGRVEARMLESDRAMLLVAINHDTRPHVVAIELPPDAPGGEWQNLETAAAIPLSGARDGRGARFEHRFGARDVLVLLARKP